METGAFVPFTCAGRHLILDVWDVYNRLLERPDEISEILVRGAETAGATVLGIFFHSFGENQGVTGIIALSESHISIHTWPEKCYAAIDIFMCGKCDPNVAANSIIKDFRHYDGDLQQLWYNKTITFRGVE